MVKHKNAPKKGTSAGYAASTAQPVNDSTDTDSSVTEPPTVVPKKNPLIKPKSKPKANYSKPGSKTLSEINKLQSSTKLLIPRAPFVRLIKELIGNRGPNFKISLMAVEALRESSECLLTSIFEDAYLLALHAKRVTLFPRDMALLLALRHDFLSNAIQGT